ncbi:hypothetical protein BpHYR1_043966 [Brachionus plicatilis]|uniref:Uncharacterized protein n=1 Tax=Brachionus plicatilis TaxID=10195 RepID=A0A3M7PVR8_BRAPC|nr:hypothetical protein BpHYR1_043966 [Brachionus plicatilis]
MICLIHNLIENYMNFYLKINLEESIKGHELDHELQFAFCKMFQLIQTLLTPKLCQIKPNLINFAELVLDGIMKFKYKLNKNSSSFDELILKIVVQFVFEFHNTDKYLSVSNGKRFRNSLSGRRNFSLASKPNIFSYLSTKAIDDSTNLAGADCSSASKLIIDEHNSISLLHGLPPFQMTEQIFCKFVVENGRIQFGDTIKRDLLNLFERAFERFVQNVEYLFALIKQMVKRSETIESCFAYGRQVCQRLVACQFAQARVFLLTNRYYFVAEQMNRIQGFRECQFEIGASNGAVSNAFVDLLFQAEFLEMAARHFNGSFRRKKNLKIKKSKKIFIQEKFFFSLKNLKITPSE